MTRKPRLLLVLLAAGLLNGAQFLTPSAVHATDAAARTFRAVQQVFTQSCAFSACHSAVGRKGGLVLDHEDVSYAALVDQPSDLPEARALGLKRVVSGDPSYSFLIRKLRGRGPGDPMPQVGGMLPEETIQMIEDWIRRGAHTTAEECPAAVPGMGGGGHGGPATTICDDTPVGGDFVWKPEAPLEPPAAGTGFQLYVPPKTVDPGAEWEYCYAFRPDFTGLTSKSIARQEYRMHQGSHHLLLYLYFGDHPEQFAEGYYPCRAGACINKGDCPDDSSAQLTIGGTQVAGTRYVVDYPPGVGLPIINYRNAVVIANLHYTNPFQPAQPIYGEAWINLFVHKAGETKAQLDGIFAINSDDLVVEPYETRTIQRVWRPRSLLTGNAADAAVFQLFGHMHKRGIEFDVDFVDRACRGDCNADDAVTVDEVMTGVNIALGTQAAARCRSFDSNGDNAVTVDEIIVAVQVVLDGCQRPADTRIYRTTDWEHAPVQEYGAPYLWVDHDQGLRWTCTHENGRKLSDGSEDPTYPAKKCHQGCDACGWEESSRTCIFRRDGSNRRYQEGEPMPLAFGLLADDDMCNMFGYFINQSDLPRLEQ